MCSKWRLYTGSKALQQSSISQKRASSWSREAPGELGWMRGGISPAYGSLLFFQDPPLSRTHVRPGNASGVACGGGRPVAEGLAPPIWDRPRWYGPENFV